MTISFEDFAISRRFKRKSTLRTITKQIIDCVVREELNVRSVNIRVYVRREATKSRDLQTLISYYGDKYVEFIENEIDLGIPITY